jgi:hypothetical protein
MPHSRKFNSKIIALQYLAITDCSTAYFIFDLVLAASVKRELRLKHQKRHDRPILRLQWQNIQGQSLCVQVGKAARRSFPFRRWRKALL